MFRSIRTNLFAAFVALMGLFLLVMLLINFVFLDDLFLYGNRMQMERLHAEIQEQLDQGASLRVAVEEPSFRSGFFVTVVNADGTVAIGSRLPGGEPMKPLDDRRPPERMTDTLQDLADQGEGFRITRQGKDPQGSLVLVRQLNEGQTLIIQKHLGAIQETSRLGVWFILASGAAVFLMGSLVVFYFSGRLTRPILELDAAARRITQKDFSGRIALKNQDELGTLGNSLQTLSDSLSGALSELEQANQKLREDIDRERKLDVMRRRFISNVSHELRTPLSMIQGYADGLRHGVAQDPEEIQNYCGVIVEESKRMGALIKDMLDLSSYESGAFRVRMEAFDLGPLAASVGSRFEKIFQDKGVAFQVQGPDRCPTYGDSRRIEQALVNFLTNAVRHTDSGGSVTVLYGAEGAETHLEVRNTGAPIPVEELETLWLPFNRGKQELETDDSGFGIGLAIVHAITLAHHGACRAENLEGEVSFRIDWPSEALEPLR